MKLIRKVIKYGIVFALGYYLGSGGCNTSYDNRKHSSLEQEVLKYEQDISKKPGYARIFYKQP